MNRKCTLEFCDRPRNRGGLCSVHHRHSVKGLPLVPLVYQQRGGTRGSCRLPLCTRMAKAKGLCHTHYERKRLGDPTWDRPTSRRNNVATIQLNIRPLRSTWAEMEKEMERSGLSALKVANAILDEWAYLQRNGTLPGVAHRDAAAWRQISVSMED